MADGAEVDQEVPDHVGELVLTCEEDNADRVADGSCEDEEEARMGCSAVEACHVEDYDPAEQEVDAPGDDLAGFRFGIHERFEQYSRQGQTPLGDAEADSHAASDEGQPDRCVCTRDADEDHAVVELVGYVFMCGSALSGVIPGRCEEHKERCDHVDTDAHCVDDFLSGRCVGVSSDGCVRDHAKEEDCHNCVSNGVTDLLADCCRCFLDASYNAARTLLPGQCFETFLQSVNILLRLDFKVIAVCKVFLPELLILGHYLSPIISFATSFYKGRHFYSTLSKTHFKSVGGPN